jgi:hypothetical protein
MICPFYKSDTKYNYTSFSLNNFGPKYTPNCARQRRNCFHEIVGGARVLHARWPCPLCVIRVILSRGISGAAENPRKCANLGGSANCLPPTPKTSQNTRRSQGRRVHKGVKDAENYALGPELCYREQCVGVVVVGQRATSAARSTHGRSDAQQRAPPFFDARLLIAVCLLLPLGQHVGNSSHTLTLPTPNKQEEQRS